MHVDDPAGLQPVDPFFDGFVSVAQVLGKPMGRKTDWPPASRYAGPGVMSRMTNGRPRSDNRTMFA
jgi:hypothetical protein